MKKILLILMVTLSSYASYVNVAHALTERHLILIRHAEGEHNVKGVYNSNPKHPDYRPAHLTAQGKKQAISTAERLVLHGFDNRNIAAVYVSPLPRTRETAELIAEYGVFSKDKIHIDDRLVEAQAGELEGQLISKYSKDAWHVTLEEHQKYEVETNYDVRKRIMRAYDDAEKKYPNGHVIFITHGLPAMELLQDIVQIEVRLNPADTYLLPLVARNNSEAGAKMG